VTVAPHPRPLRRPADPSRPAPRWRSRLFAAVLLGLLAVLAGPAAPASAHAALAESSPAPDSLLQEAPTQVVLTFTETVNPVAGKIRVIAPDGSRVDRDEVRVSGQQVIIPLQSVTAAGTYLVSYRVVSADSHPVGGAFSFSYKEVSPGGPPSGEIAPQASGFVLTALPIARWLGYLGLLLLVGSVLVLTLLWPRRLSRERAVRVVWLGAGLVALATVLELALDIPYVAGGGLGDITGSDVREVLSSQYGAAHLVRLGVLVAALVLLRPVLAGRGWGGDKVLLAVLGVIGVATWSISGHPSASPVPTVTVAADMIHLAAMSVWLGGLVMLAAFLLRQANATELGAIVPVWSRWAGWAVSALLITGVAQALIEVGSFSALVDTSYGALVLTKVGLAAVVLGVAAVSRRLVAVIADGAEGSAARLRMLVVIETAIAVVVLGVTSVLVQLTPARSQTPTSTQPALQTAVLTSDRFVLTVDLTPATVGQNELHMYAATPDGRPLTVVEWTVKASNEAAGIEALDAAVVRFSPDHAAGQVGLPAAGTWRFVFTLRLDETTNGIVATDFTVRS
jgi:copper transport protein